MQRIMSFIAGLMAGAVVGAVSALLLTPASGEELQSRVRDQVEVVISEARQAAVDRRAVLSQRLEDLKEGIPLPAANED